MSVPKTHTGQLIDPLSESAFDVTINYVRYDGVRTNLNTSIESYELEGDNISREELVERFGEVPLRNLEELIDNS